MDEQKDLKNDETVKDSAPEINFARICRKAWDVVSLPANAITTLIEICDASIEIICLSRILRWNDLIWWFREWIDTHKDIKEDVIGFTLREESQSGAYKLVQGIFNKSPGKVEAARRIKVEKVDDEVKKNCFGKEELTIFQ